MGKLIELYRNFEIRWVRWGEEGAYHVISPKGTPLKEVGTVRKAKRYIDELYGDEQPPAPRPTRGSNLVAGERLSEPVHQLPACSNCGKGKGYMPGRLCGFCWLEGWGKRS